MTRGSRGGLSGVPRLWILPLGVMAGVAYSVFVGLLSRSLILDFAAWWPAWLALVGLTILARDRRWGPIRVSGLVALLAMGVVVGFLVGHLQGWQSMPSAGGALIGPEVLDIESVDMTVSAPGSIVVTPGSDYLYEASPIRWGGDVGIAEGLEEVSGTTMRVTLQPDADPGLQTFEGWDVFLSPAPAWSIDLSGQVDADLRSLEVVSVDVAGSGSVRLGEVTRATTVTVDGAYTIMISQGQAARVIGEADVPDDWLGDGDGRRAPVEGEGWVIEVAEGAQVVVTGP